VRRLEEALHRCKDGSGVVYHENPGSYSGVHARPQAALLHLLVFDGFRQGFPAEKREKVTEKTHVRLLQTKNLVAFATCNALLAISYTFIHFYARVLLLSMAIGAVVV